MGGWEEKWILKLTSAKGEVEVEAELGNITILICVATIGTLTGENINEVKEMETSVAADGTSEVKLTPEEGTKEIKDDEFEDPLKKPLVLDDGRWAVFSW